MHGAFEDDDAATTGLEIAVGLIAVRAPFFRGSLRECRRWTEHALAAAGRRAPAPLRVTALAMLSWICLCQGDHDEAGRLLDRCVALCGADPEERADPSDDRELPAPVDFARGCQLLLVHRDPRAVAVFARARVRAAAGGDLCAAAQYELFEALAAAFLAAPGPALRITERHLENAIAANARWARSWAELARAIALLRCGDPAPALALGRNALAAQLAMRDAWGTVWAVHIRAWALGASWALSMDPPVQWPNSGWSAPPRSPG